MGDEFQKFFSDVMSARHGDAFMPSIALGGDRKCDGMTLDPLIVYGCYGPRGGGSYLGESMADAVSKVVDDYLGACEKWPDMVEWRLANNFIAGMPPQIAAALLEARKKGKKPFGYFGKESFLQTLGELDDFEVERLIGPIVMLNDYRNLVPAVVKDVVDRIADKFTQAFPEGHAKPVPPDKMEINKIPPCHANELKNGFVGHRQVEALVGESPDPTLEGRLSAAFRGKYVDLRGQGLPPGAVVDALYDFAVGGGSETSERRATAWAVLAYLFERCTIFEDNPWESAA
jgi:hypothetical protein